MRGGKHAVAQGVLQITKPLVEVPNFPRAGRQFFLLTAFKILVVLMQFHVQVVQTVVFMIRQSYGWFRLHELESRSRETSW
ncbi:MAG: hypothetical protein CBC48_10065 [bacterium TMED88]|nr:hypothetical protein [Deltaproteobacteria bacterium]OUV30922.1 MAG: hypothetical protein CBC48_10065 [bacterium TMED88]